MRIAACEVSIGAPAALTCGCMVRTGHSYETAAHEAGLATRPWIVESPCAAHPARARAILELRAGEPVKYSGDEPPRRLSRTRPYDARIH